MSSRLCRCGVLAGALLIVLAALLLLQIDQPYASAQHAQRARLVSTLARLEGCQTCHAAAPQAVRLIAPELTVDTLRAVALAEVPPSSSSPLSGADRLPTELHAQLVHVGQRLLALPASDDVRTRATVEAYVQIAQAALDGPAQAEWGSMWAALQAIALAVRDLENAAAPVQWRAVASGAQSSPTGALPALPLTSVPAAVIGVWALVRLLRSSAGCALRRVCARLPREIVYAVRRRGPPLAAHRTWGLRRRLVRRTQMCAQSSFLCV